MSKVLYSSIGLTPNDLAIFSDLTENSQTFITLTIESLIMIKTYSLPIFTQCTISVNPEIFRKPAVF